MRAQIVAEAIQPSLGEKIGLQDAVATDIDEGEKQGLVRVSGAPVVCKGVAFDVGEACLA